MTEVVGAVLGGVEELRHGVVVAHLLERGDDRRLLEIELPCVERRPGGVGAADASSDLRGLLGDRQGLRDLSDGDAEVEQLGDPCGALAVGEARALIVGDDLLHDAGRVGSDLVAVPGADEHRDDGGVGGDRGEGAALAVDDGEGAVTPSHGEDGVQDSVLADRGDELGGGVEVHGVADVVGDVEDAGVHHCEFGAECAGFGCGGVVLVGDGHDGCLSWYRLW
nr:hypothetical protein [Rhodococcus sp. SORGH_AS_0301]